VARDPQNNPAIISDATRAGSDAWALFALLVLVGAAGAAFYAWRDLTLSHYDARAHLVVARRITDSLVPGWHQFGAVWLPLPHILNAAPVTIDWNYRTGFSGVLISVSALAIGLTAVARYLHIRTGSPAAALTAPALILLNPNVLYLQSTPMTEPLLFGLSLASVAAIDAVVTAPSAATRRMAGLCLAALVLTRYEGWCIAAALCAILAASRRRPFRRVLEVGAYPAAAIALFLLMSWGATGEWFVTSGFFVPDNPVRHQPLAVAGSILASVEALGGRTLMAAALIGAVSVGFSARRRAAALLPLALVASAALPAVAFYDGHPHRVRYMVPLVVAAGVLAAAGVGRVPRPARGAAAAALVLAVWIERPPLDPAAPMVVESQWETPYRLGRETVTRALVNVYDGQPILASMGSLAHYMQESSAYGFDLAQYLHEGNGLLWTFALSAPRRHVNWVLIEEQAEGGDVLAGRVRADPEYLAGFARIAEGGGLALYRRDR
jgi:hypothetical protein